ncbi:sugar phosphate isomerase/epimerase [Flavobacterium sp. 3HN19-14]|uniref:sugar phosphate isomerase/epimerase n=1 Tax=Flavobacterium sp. 3HN19-14 TaxID=3448133 RepID=UPI003EDEEE45
MMEINYCCTHWGSEAKDPMDFLTELVKDGYSELEINLSPGNFDDVKFFDKLEALRSLNNFSFIAQQVLGAADETTKDYIKRMKERLIYLMDFQPDFINSHTGKDFYSFNDNCRIIDEAENIAAKFGIPIRHETHRGRFSFHLCTLIPYLKKFPQMQLTADFSHWCCVSESMLEDQSEKLQQVIPHIGHLHARVGSEQSAQAGHPFAPEWKNHLDVFTNWWKEIIIYKQSNHEQLFTITPEFGPAPYMPEIPFSRQPLSMQWEINLMIKGHLQNELNGFI